MKTVNFKTFTITNGDDEKEFFEEGLIYNDMEMISVVDARLLYEKKYNEDPFFETDPKDIVYILDLYQKLELFDVEKVDFKKLHSSLSFHHKGQGHPTWLHWDGTITEAVGPNTNIPEDIEDNPVITVFISFPENFPIHDDFEVMHKDWKKHIIEVIRARMIEIEADHAKASIPL